MNLSRNIEANPVKVHALLSSKKPKNLHDVQVITGKMASLHRFLAKQAKKSLSFYKILIGLHPKGKFSWTEECRQAFKELKRHLNISLLLTSSLQGKTLHLYFVVAQEVVGPVLEFGASA